MDVGSSCVVHCEPGAVDAVSVRQFVKDAITAKNNKVMVVLDLKRLYISNSDNAVRITSVFR